MNIKKLCFSFASALLISLSSCPYLLGQNIQKAREMMDTLASPGMYGRGYVNNGIGLAADFIKLEMINIGLKPFKPGYNQYFEVNVKTYPTTVDLKINDKALVPGTEFSILSGSPSVSHSYNLVKIDSSLFKSGRTIKKFKKKDYSNTLIMYNPSEMKGKYRKAADSLLRNNYINCAGFIHVSDKNSIIWSVYAREEVLPYPILVVLSSALPDDPSTAEVNIELKAVNNYKVSNVIGYIPGTSQPDSFVVVTAHYDHLGMMGNKTYFPGANDNASGIAMMLDIAEHYNKPETQLPFSIAFMAFASEEIGLKGSYHAAENPLFPLENIKFLLNLDMVGTGSEGITMVNAVQFPSLYDKMVKINADNDYIMKVAKRGESCNSDHCPFYKLGVPAVFIYSNGSEHKEYHNVNDQSHKVPLSEYEDIFRLLRDFINQL
jgi:aminopeptidase YwaD